MSEGEILIKSRKRVQQHGEVFTPKEIVDAMVTLPGLEEAIKQVTTTVLEPSVGEGAFLTNILERRLDVLEQLYSEDIVRFENYALLALSTLYGIELLEDNAQKCVINIYMVFHERYEKIAMKANCRMKKNVLESAKTIISANIVQGDFLKRTLSNGNPIVFSEWKHNPLTNRTKNIKVTRTEFSLDEIFAQSSKQDGTTMSSPIISKQISFFDTNDGEKEKSVEYIYVPTKIVDAYKQEMEEAS